MDYKSYLKQLLEATIKNNASDFHIAEGRPPVMRISRKLVFSLRKINLQLKIQRVLLLF